MYSHHGLFKVNDFKKNKQLWHVIVNNWSTLNYFLFKALEDVRRLGRQDPGLDKINGICVAVIVILANTVSYHFFFSKESMYYHIIMEFVIYTLTNV